MSSAFPAKDNCPATDRPGIAGSRYREHDVGLAERGNIDAMMAFQWIKGNLMRIQFFDKTQDIGLIRTLDCYGHGRVIYLANTTACGTG